MRIRLPLYAQIFGMLFLYLLTLATVVFISFNAQFGLGWDALIKSPLGDRVNTIADAIAGQLSASKRDRWDEILRSYSGHHHVKFYIFDVFGHQLAGEKIPIPPEVAARVPEFDPHRLPPPDWGPPPPGLPGTMFGGPPPLMQDPRFQHPGSGSVPGFPDNLSKMPMPFDGGMPPPPMGELSGGMAGPGPGPGPGLDGPMPFGRTGGPMAPGGPSGKAAATGPNGPTGPGGPGGPISPGSGHIRGHHFLPPELSHAHGQFMVHSENPDRFWICTRVRLNPADSPFPMHAVLVGISDNIWQNNLIIDARFALESAAVLIFLSLIFWWPFVHSISHSLSKLTKATEGIAEGKFDTRLSVSRGDEIGRLSDAVNIMAERLASFVTGQKRFLGDISHELFSPIARLQMALELLDEDATESQKSLVQDIREEINEMNSLVNELLAFSKAGLKGKDLELSAVSPKTIVTELIERMNLADKVTLNFTSDSKVTADSLLLGRAISNVLRNSVRYAGDKGPITIATEKHGEQLAIVISDCGSGVPEEALKRLTEPFFRPEASRSRSSGGVGLGLAIVQSCIEACNGKLMLRNRPQGGFEVEIRLEAA